MKNQLCQAFCGELLVRNVPAGLAVSTVFDNTDGDPIGFYIIGPDAQGKYRIEDNGASITFIEAAGASLKNKTRQEAFQNLLEEYNVDYNEDTGELVTNPLKEGEVPHAAIRFVAMLLRVQDIILMAAERAASTFREDVMQALKQDIGEKATITENEAVDTKLSDFPADVEKLIY